MFRKSFGGGDESEIWSGWIFEHFEHAEAVAAGELDVFRIPDDGSGGGECMAEDEICEVGAVECYGADQEGLLVGTKADGHAAVVFNGWAGHGGVSQCTH